VLTLCRNAEIVNTLANHPSVKPFIQHIVEGNIDITHQVEDPNNVCLLGGYGCVLFYKQQSGIYEFHTMVLPEGRGEWAYKGGKWAFNYMFTHTDAFELLTRCPDGNLASKALSKLLGMKKAFRTLPNFKFRGEFVSCDVMSIVIQEWVTNDETLTARGKWFHEFLENEYKRVGKNIEIHDVDDTHDHYVGCAVEMLKNRQITKAVAMYNRWAHISGYQPISVVSLEPLVVDIQEAKLKIFSDTFEVI
jgi:hypothetical protein